MDAAGNSRSEGPAVRDSHFHLSGRLLPRTFFDLTGAVTPRFQTPPFRPHSPSPTSMPAAQHQRLPSSPRDEDHEASTRISPKRPIDLGFDRPPLPRNVSRSFYSSPSSYGSYAIRPTKQSTKPEVIYASETVRLGTCIAIYSQVFKGVQVPTGCESFYHRAAQGRGGVRLRGAYPST